MRILLISRDRPLAEAIASSVLRNGDLLITADELGAGSRKWVEEACEVCIVSDRLTEGEEARQVAERFPANGRRTQLIWLLSNQHHAAGNARILKECLSEGFHVIHPGLSQNQVAERIHQLIYGISEPKRESRNGIIHFLGTTPNIGTSVAAFGTALYMAMLTDRRIGHLCLNLKSAKMHRYLGEREPSLTLDGMRPELKSGNVSPERLLRQCRSSKEQPNLHVLYGNLHREQADYYSIEEIDCLLSAAKDAFDICVVDTCAYWDNAATIGAMLQAGQRILVTAPQLSYFQEDLNRWCKVLCPVIRLSPADFDVLITQLEAGASFRSREIAKEAEMQRIGELRKWSGLNPSLDEGRLREWLVSDKSASADLSRFAGTLLTLLGERYLKAALPMQGLSRLSGLFQLGRRVGFAGK